VYVALLVPIERIRYFSGQLLAEADFTEEQLYLREKARRHNRLLHGWGIVCGLLVRPGPARGELTLEPGYALDPHGEEIVVEDEVVVDLCSEDDDGNVLSPCRRPGDPRPTRVQSERAPGRPLYLAIRYAECPTRPVTAGESLEYSRMRESFAVKVLTELPASYRRHHGEAHGRPCPDAAAEPWVVLAEVVLDPDLTVSSLDCLAHQRRVVPPSAAV